MPAHQRLLPVGRPSSTDLRAQHVDEQQQQFVDVSELRSVSVLRVGHRVRGHRDGRRSLVGTHQTVFLPKGKSRYRVPVEFLLLHYVYIYPVSG